MKKIISLPPNYFYACIILNLLFYFLISTFNIIEEPFNFIGVILIIIGIFLVIKSWTLFKKYNTPESFSKSSYLIKDSLFNFSRNPMYLGGLMFLLGLFFALGNILGLISPIIFFFIIDRMFIPHEEEKMFNTFGEKYLDYKKQVRRWI